MSRPQCELRVLLAMLLSTRYSNSGWRFPALAVRSDEVSLALVLCYGSVASNQLRTSRVDDDTRLVQTNKR